MKAYFVKTPQWIKHLFNKQIWSFETDQKILYLTFDDGPIPEVTPWVLKQLSKYNAKATFFCIGDNIKKHPKIYNQLIEENHKIGNHTFSHLNGWKTSCNNYLKDIKKAGGLIKSRLFRPPYGKISPKQANALRKEGFSIIMWDVLSADFDNSISNEKCFNNVINNTNDGSIIVFHDSIKAQSRLKYVFPKVLEYYTKQGYVFEAINFSKK